MSMTDDIFTGGAAPAGGDGGGRRGWARSLRRYWPFAAVAVLVLAAVVVFRSGSDDGGGEATGSGDASEVDNEALIRSGPMTPQKAELLGETGVDFGPRCDLETGRIMLPTVYAPPCVAPLAGDNGGATSPGVTGDAIKLVLYMPKQDFFTSMLADVEVELDPGPTTATVQDYVDLYGQVFETYGRTVQLEVYTGRGAADDEAQARADAIAIAEMEPFAVLGGPFVASVPFADELAARGVVCLPGCAAAGLPESFVAERAPYLWPDGMTATQQGRLAAETIGTLAPPGPAELAGDPALRNAERAYAVVHLEGDGATEMSAALRDGLAEHGIEDITDIEYSIDPGQVQEDTRNLVVQLEDAGVTTVIVTGAPFTPGFLTHEATAQDYAPEWILGPNYFADTRVFTAQADQDQWVNGFGIGFKLSAQTTAGQAPSVYEWGYDGAEPQIATPMPYAEPAVRMLFTGTHLAGPELTPESFRDGLFRFPPSGDGVTSATVSWGDHEMWPEVDYTGEDDVTVIWWDPAAVNPDPPQESVAGPGLYRLANGGQRYTLGAFPESAEAAGLFDVESSVVMYGAPLPPEVDALFERYPPPS
jgi:hypothetical protein